MSKKSLIFSESGRSLKELKEKETFVRKIVRTCTLPNVKSLKIIFEGFEIKACPLNSLPITI